MTNEDARAHPWPADGKLIELRYRDAVWMPTRPWYEANGADFHLEDIWFLALFKGRFPFLTWNLKWRGWGVHGYIGFKPIPVATDPAFDWSKLDVAQKHIREGALFVQLGARGGLGAVS